MKFEQQIHFCTDKKSLHECIKYINRNVVDKNKMCKWKRKRMKFYETKWYSAKQVHMLKRKHTVVVKVAERNWEIETQITTRTTKKWIQLDFLH